MDSNLGEAAAQGGDLKFSLDEVRAWLRSDFFRQALDESGESPEERAELLRDVGRRLFTHFESCQSVESLNDAIRFTREALGELPAGHGAIIDYADALVFYAQTKAVMVQGPESINGYISAIQIAIDATREGPSHQQFVQRLAWAYWARFEASGTDDDLKFIITYINELANTHEYILPQTELVLGDAYYSRFSRTKATQDIEKALELLEKALKSPEVERPVRQLYLQKMVKYSVDKLRHTHDENDIHRLISNARFAISELPHSGSKENIEKLLSWAETSIELFDTRRFLDTIFSKLGDLKLDGKNGPKPIGKTHVPEGLYDKFPIGQKDIRTLELMPGKSKEEIVCKLHTAPLAGDVKYESLSYTWGNPERVSNITIETYECKVTVNLVLALRRLRRQDAPRMLWVDAVCINQQNYPEKSHQISLMGEIYKRSSQVLTWLEEPSAEDDARETESPPHALTADYEMPSIEWGKENDISLMREFFTENTAFSDWPVVGAVSTLTLLARDCHLNSLPFFQDPRYPEFNAGIYPSELWQQSSKALYQLLESPYWKRVWIAQEIILGNRVLIHYGRHVVPFQIFIDAQRCMRKHYYGCCYNYCAAESNNQWSTLFCVLVSLDSIGDLAAMKSALANQRTMDLFDTLLSGIDFREATDPKDQIYGLLGLIPDHLNDDLLRPDYSLSLAQVYTRAAFKIMQESRNLRLLSYSDRQCDVEDLPSWCHDFNNKAPFNPLPYCWKLFNACNIRGFKISLDAVSRLEVRGYHLDTITHVTEARTPQSLSRRSFTRWIDDSLKLAVKYCATEGGQYRAAETSLHIDEAYGRTLIGDTFTYADGSSRRATPEDIQLLYAWFQWIRENVSYEDRDWAARQPPTVFTEISSNLLATTQSKKLFITKERRLGMGVSTVFGQEKEVLNGDQIWLLQGSNLPVILRHIPVTAQKPGVSADSYFNYALVSTGYVHGIMDGEACPSANLFTEITIGHYPKLLKSPSPRNESMRNALRMSLIQGYGDYKTRRSHPRHAAKSNTRTDEARDEEQGEDQRGMNAEAMLFPEGRQWPESMKPIPQHRVILASLVENPPATEEEWEEFEKSIEERLVKNKEE